MTKQKLKAGVLASSVALAAIVAGCNGGGGGGANGGPQLPSGGGSVATVNGESVDREALRDHLEANGGEAALRQLIDFALVMQKAKANNIAVSDAEIDASIEERRKQEEESLKAQPDSPMKQEAQIPLILKNGGVRLAALKRQTRYQLTLDKLLTREIKADEATIKKWFEANRKDYDEPERVKIGFLMSSTKAYADTMAAQLKSKSKSFQELVAERQKSNDQVGKGSQMEAAQPIPTAGLPPELKATIAKLQKGQTSSVQAIGKAPRQAFLIVRLVDRMPGVQADYNKIKDRVATDYKLEQAARKANEASPQKLPFDQAIQQVQMYMAQNPGSAPPTRRAAINLLNQQAASKLMDDMKKAAKVEVKDATYNAVGKDFKPRRNTPGATTPPASAPKTP